MKVFDITNDITYKEEKDVINLHFVSNFIKSRQKLYETQKLCFAIGANCKPLDIGNKAYDQYAKDYAEFRGAKDIEQFIAFHDIDEKTKKRYFILPESFNIPRTVLNKQLEKEEIRYLYIIAMMRKEERILTNFEMQKIWEDVDSKLYKEAARTFQDYVTLGAQYFVYTFFDLCNEDISDTFISLNYLGVELNIEATKKVEEETEKDFNYQNEIEKIDAKITELNSEIAQLQRQKSTINLQSLKL